MKREKRLIFCTFYNEKKTFLRLFNGAKDRAKVVDFRSSTGSDRRLFLSSQMSMSSEEEEVYDPYLDVVVQNV